MAHWSMLSRLHWRHNGFMGHARMMQHHAHDILSSSTATDETVEIAIKIEALAEQLYLSLKKRRNPRVDR